MIIIKNPISKKVFINQIFGTLKVERFAENYNDKDH